MHKINDKTLSILIYDKLNLGEAMCDQKKYGYFCYEYQKNKINYNIEALYSIIDPINLYNYCQLKNLIDDYNHPNPQIKNFYIKNRAMALEYYINISVFMEKYNIKPFPRIIYPLYNKKIDFDLLNEIEIDGAFFVENEFTIKDEDLPFIFQNFLSFSGSNKVYKCINFKVDLDGKKFKQNDLCLLEIKTEFPEKFPTDNRETFSEVLEKMLEKMIIFERLFASLDVKYDRIRLILFYDLVVKNNYTYEIKNVLTKFAKNHNKLKYLNKIHFQVIYVNASYFVGALRTNAEEIKNLKGDLENSQAEIKTLTQKIGNLESTISELKNSNNNLEQRLKNLEEKYQNNDKSE